jgi:hypothetical protein
LLVQRSDLRDSQRPIRPRTAGSCHLAHSPRPWHTEPSCKAHVEPGQKSPATRTVPSRDNAVVKAMRDRGSNHYATERDPEFLGRQSSPSVAPRLQPFKAMRDPKRSGPTRGHDGGPSRRAALHQGRAVIDPAKQARFDRQQSVVRATPETTARADALQRPHAEPTTGSGEDAGTRTT